jgi:hypothetical protein
VIARVGSFLPLARLARSNDLAAVLPLTAAVEFEGSKMKVEPRAWENERSMVLLANARTLEAQASAPVQSPPLPRSFVGKEATCERQSDVVERFEARAGPLHDGRISPTRAAGDMDDGVEIARGYFEPVWWRDRRPQPLRSRMTTCHFRTLLRREAVARLRMKGRSFRQIGRELGVSQVAARKLWNQIVEDVIARVSAERRGEQILGAACQQRDAVSGEQLRRIWEIVGSRFGPRVANRFLGRTNRPSSAEAQSLEALNG